MLNPEQEAAVRHPFDRPAVVIAGAGSGKTRIITERVRHLISNGVPASRIACLTFTNKAANEMLRRLSFDEHTDKPRIGTIHSLALWLIRQEPDGFGLRSGITILDDHDQAQAVKRILDQKGVEDAHLRSYALLKRLDFHRARGIGFSADYAAQSEAALELYGGHMALLPDDIAVWAEFEAHKKAANQLDFDDMLHLCLARAKTDRNWTAAVGSLFDHVLVDEAQDLSGVQWKFVDILVRAGNQNIYPVGDYSQSIFAFQGASPAILAEYVREGWRGVKPDLYGIPANYRSGRKIVELANRIQATMQETIPLTMQTACDFDGHVGLTEFSDDDTQAQQIAQVVQRSHTAGRLLREHAVLVRSKSQLRPLEAAMARTGIPYCVRGGAGLLGTEEIRDLTAYMRLAINPHDTVAFRRAVAAPKRHVGNVAIATIESASKNQHTDLLSASLLTTRGKLEGFVEMLRNASTMSPLMALTEILRRSNYDNDLVKRYGNEPARLDYKRRNISILLDIVGSMEQMGLGLQDTVLRLSMGKPDEDKDDGRVVLSTIHSAKGLEWDYVFITNLYEGSLPHQWCRTDSEIEEERRLLYVAVTRARKSALLCCPRIAIGRPVARSRFLS